VITIDNSYVKHLNTKGVKYVEEWDNNFIGALNEHNNKFFAKFTNSFGDDSTIQGNWRRLGPLYMFWGQTYGYKRYPNGVFYAGIGFKFKGQVRMLMPGIGEGLNRVWLSICADIKEYPDGKS